MNQRYTVTKAPNITGPQVPDDEPVLVIRAQDVLAPEMMDYYLNRYLSLPTVMRDPAVVEELQSHRQALLQWQETHPTKVADR